MFQRFICVVGIGLAAVAAMSGAEKDGMAEYLNGTLPQRWSYSPEIPMDAPEATDAWWQSFGDSILDSLVAAGISNNYDVAMAMRRAEIARNSIRQRMDACDKCFGRMVCIARKRKDCPAIS